MMKSSDVCIIGAGPAGIMAGITCAEQGLSVRIIEKNGRAGLKLLLAGGGRCNVTHGGSPKDFLSHYHDKGRFVKPAMYHFSNGDLSRFFENAGLPLITADDGKIFPSTLKSADVVRVLTTVSAQTGVDIVYDTPVHGIVPTSNGFRVDSSGGSFISRSIVIATGGISYPQTGANGDGYNFARQLGHTTAPLCSALAPVMVRQFQFASCAGISLQKAPLLLLRSEKRIHSGCADVLITHHGLSGPGILDISRYVRAGDTLKVGLVDFADKDAFEADLIKVMARNGAMTLKKTLLQYKIPERLLMRVGEVFQIPLNVTNATTEKKVRARLVDTLLGCPFLVDRCGGYNEAMVTCGGVSLAEINAQTMQSRLVPHLYFAGEVVDVDGETGGYNLQFAFSSGALAGKSIGAQLLKEGVGPKASESARHP